MRTKNTSDDSVSRRPAEAAVWQRAGKEPPIPPRDNVKFTKLEAILVKARCARSR